MFQGPTTNHEEIRRWAEQHNAQPVEVATRKFDGEPTNIRFIFGNPAGDITDFRRISWEQFFATFDLLGWSFVYDGDSQYELLQIEDKSTYRFDGKPV